MTFGDLLGVKRVVPGTLQIAPDGRRIAYVEESDRQKDGLLVLIASEKPRVVATFKGSMPVWSPDGRHLAYLATSATEPARQVWLYDMQLGTHRQLTHVPSGIAPQSPVFDELAQLAWAPNGRAIAFTAPPERAAAPSPIGGTPRVFDNSTSRDAVVGDLLSGIGLSKRLAPVAPAQIFLIDVSSGTVSQLTHGNRSYGTPNWSPDSRQLVCAIVEAPEVDSFRHTQISIIDVVGGKSRTITDGLAARINPSWAPNGRWIAYQVQDPDIFAPASLRFTSPDDVSIKPPRDMPLGADGFSYGWAWSSDSDAIFFIADDVRSPSMPLRRYQLVDGTIRQLSAADEYVTALSSSHAGILVWAASSPTAPGYLTAARQEAREGARIWDLNPQATDWTLGTQLGLHYRSSRGHDRFGLLVLPTGYRSGQHYPTLVSCYAFPAHAGGFQGNSSAGYGNQAMAAMGYAVFFPRPLVSQLARSYARIPGMTDELGGPDGVSVMTEDVLAGVAEVVRLGIADPDRVALIGHSNAGAPIHNLVVATDMFKAAVVVAGVGVDIFDQALRWPEWTARWSMIDRPVYEDPEAYARWSALFRVSAIHTPMLLAVGENDSPTNETYAEYYIALRYYGKDVTLLAYPDQGHEIDVPSRVDFFEREMAFIASHLQYPVSNKTKTN